MVRRGMVWIGSLLNAKAFLPTARICYRNSLLQGSRPHPRCQREGLPSACRRISEYAPKSLFLLVFLNANGIAHAKLLLP